MFRVEFISLAVPAEITMLCDSSRHLAEHNLRFNARRVLDYVDLVRAANAVGFYRGNRRNILQFSVRRDLDYGGKEFGDPEAAFAFALDHGDRFDGAGLVRLTLIGPKTAEVRWLNNAFVEAHDLSEVLGVANLYAYTINAGDITRTKP